MVGGYETAALCGAQPAEQSDPRLDRTFIGAVSQLVQTSSGGMHDPRLAVRQTSVRGRKRKGALVIDVAWLTVLRRNGSPHTTPVWFVVGRDRIWVASAQTNRKVQHLAFDSRVSIAFEGSSSRPVVAEGHALIHVPAELTTFGDVLAKFSSKYRGWDASSTVPDGPRVLIEIRPSRWLLGALTNLGDV